MVLFTIDDLSTLAKQASRIIKISAPSPKLQKSNNLDSIQPMGSLFEQSLLITLETIVVLLMERLGLDSETMFKNHANLELLFNSIKRNAYGNKLKYLFYFNFLTIKDDYEISKIVFFKDYDSFIRNHIYVNSIHFCKKI